MHRGRSGRRVWNPGNTPLRLRGCPREAHSVQTRTSTHGCPVRRGRSSTVSAEACEAETLVWYTHETLLRIEQATSHMIGSRHFR